MTVCTSCGKDSPGDMQHCTHCGSRLPEPEIEAPGNTSHFGDQDLKNLMSRLEREEAAPADSGNLLAGLPRPKVGSMLSPLRGGQAPTAGRKPEKSRRSAAGSTVMGMPLFTTGEQRAVLPLPRARTPVADVADAGAGLADGSSIQSLGSFQGDIGDHEPRARPTTDGLAPVREEPAELDAPAANGSPSADRRLVGSESSDEAPAGAASAQDAAEIESAPVPGLPGPEALDITSPDRPTTRAPQVTSAAASGESGGMSTVVWVVVIAGILAAAAFLALK